MDQIGGLFIEAQFTTTVECVGGLLTVTENFTKI